MQAQVAKELNYVLKETDPEKYFASVVEKIGTMSPLDIVHVWIRLLDLNFTPDPTLMLVAHSKCKMMLRAALSEAKTTIGLSSGGETDDYIEETLRRCIPLCVELRRSYTDLENHRFALERMDGSDRTDNPGSGSSSLVPPVEHHEVYYSDSSRPSSAAAANTPQVAPVAGDSLRALLEKCCDEQKAHQLAMDARLDAMERKFDAIATTRLDVLEQKLDAIATTRLEIPLVAAQQMQERVTEMGRGLDKHVQDMESKLTATIEGELKKARDTTGDELKQLQAHLDERINNVNTSIDEKFGLVQTEMESMRAEVRTEMDHMHTALEQVPEAPAAAGGDAGGAPGVSPETSAGSIGRRGAPRLRRASSESPPRNPLLPFRAGAAPNHQKADNALYRGDPTRSAFDYELEPWDT